jgi:transposase-like protein
MNFKQCPKCNSTNIEDTTEETVFPDTVYQDWKCIDCKTEWTIEYQAVALTIYPKEE